MFNSSVGVIASIERCPEIPLQAAFGQHANPPPGVRQLPTGKLTPRRKTVEV